MDSNLENPTLKTWSQVRKKHWAMCYGKLRRSGIVKMKTWGAAGFEACKTHGNGGFSPRIGTSADMNLRSQKGDGRIYSIETFGGLVSTWFQTHDVNSSAFPLNTLPKICQFNSCRNKEDNLGLLRITGGFKSYLWNEDTSCCFPFQISFFYSNYHSQNMSKQCLLRKGMVIPPKGILFMVG